MTNIDIAIAGLIVGLIAVAMWRSNGNNSDNINNNKQKTKPPTSPVMRLSRSVGGGLNLLQNPDVVKPGT